MRYKTSEKREIIDLVEKSLDQVPYIAGVNNHMGSKFTEDRDAMTVVMNELKSRGLLFLDSRTSAHSVGTRLAHEMGVPAVAPTL